MKINGFDWDNGNITKCCSHGVAIHEIEQVFTNSPQILPDIKHSKEEVRYLAIGKNNNKKHIFLAFTYRNKPPDIFIRVISARYMHQKEIDNYKKYEK